MNTYVAGSFCFGSAIDSAGNIWVANQGNGFPGTAASESNVTELSPSGAIIGTYVAGSVPIGIAIDKSGNVWVENYGNGTPGTLAGESNVTELSPSGATIGTYAVGSYPAGGIAVDTSGNIWVTNWGAKSETPGTPGTAVAGESNVTELSPSGATIGTYVAGSSPGGIAIDSSGNIWVANKGNGTQGMGLMDSNVTELSSSGAWINTYVAGSFPEGIAIDPTGNVWVVNKGDGTQGTAAGDSNVTELSPSGATIGTYAVGSYPEIVAIDSAGNVWVTNGYGRGGVSQTDSSVTELSSSGVRYPHLRYWLSTLRHRHRQIRKRMGDELRQRNLGNDPGGQQCSGIYGGCERAAVFPLFRTAVAGCRVTEPSPVMWYGR